MDLHPQLYKDNVNGTNNSQPLGDAPVKDQCIDGSHEDCYPAAIRAIENSNSQELRDKLHELEKGH